MDTSVTCRIETAAEGRMLFLTGIVESEHQLAGHAALDVGTKGRAGGSRNIQRTAFSIGTEGGAAVVGRVGVALSQGVSFTARLRIDWEGGEAVCHLP